MTEKCPGIQAAAGGEPRDRARACEKGRKKEAEEEEKEEEEEVTSYKTEPQQGGEDKDKRSSEYKSIGHLGFYACLSMFHLGVYKFSPQRVCSVEVISSFYRIVPSGALFGSMYAFFVFLRVSYTNKNYAFETQLFFLRHLKNKHIQFEHFCYFLRLRIHIFTKHDTC